MKMKRLTKIGIALSAGWLLIIGVIIGRDANGALAMKLNEAGDFLAGVTAPLALLWLVVGYFQHGEELKLNTKALHAQQEELRRQVEETATLAKNAERQAKAAEDVARLNKEEQEREEKQRAAAAQPEFLVGSIGSSREGTELTIRNQGADIRDVEFNCEAQHEATMSPKRRWESGSSAVMRISGGRNSLRYPIRFELGYTDRLKVRHLKLFELKSDHEVREVAGEAEEETEA